MPIYVYQVLDSEDGLPTGEIIEEYQHMSDEPLTKHPITGAPVRRTVTAIKQVRVGKERTKDRAKVHRGEGVFNPAAAKRGRIPFVSDTLAYDDRDGVPEQMGAHTVRRHADGTLTTYAPHDDQQDKRPIVPDETHRAKWCERQGVKHRKE